MSEFHTADNPRSALIVFCIGPSGSRCFRVVLSRWRARPHDAIRLAHSMAFRPIHGRNLAVSDPLTFRHCGGMTEARPLY